MSAYLFPRNVGHFGCTACGRIRTFHHARPKLVWVLCKDCTLVYQKGGPITRHPPLPGSRYARPAMVDLSGPELEPVYWDCFNYNLLTYKPEEDREQPIRYPMNVNIDYE